MRMHLFDAIYWSTIILKIDYHIFWDKYLEVCGFAKLNSVQMRPKICIWGASTPASSEHNIDTFDILRIFLFVKLTLSTFKMFQYFSSSSTNNTAIQSFRSTVQKYIFQYYSVVHTKAECKSTSSSFAMTEIVVRIYLARCAYISNKLSPP